MNNPRIIELRQQIRTLADELAELMRAEGYRDDCPCGEEWCPLDEEQIDPEPGWARHRADNTKAFTERLKQTGDTMLIQVCDMCEDPGYGVEFVCSKCKAVLCNQDECCVHLAKSDKFFCIRCIDLLPRECFTDEERETLFGELKNS